MSARRNHGRSAEFGVVEWIRPGEHRRVPRVLDEMKAIGATRLRTGISWADYHTLDGPDWFAWLLPELSRHVEVLPCFQATPPSLGIVEKSSAPPRDPKAYADFLDTSSSPRTAGILSGSSCGTSRRTCSTGIGGWTPNGRSSAR